MMISKLLTALALLMAQTAIAATPDKQITCPTAAAIQYIGVVDAIEKDGPWLAKKDGSWYGVIWLNHFGTAHEWTFVVGPFIGHEAVAILKSNYALDDLKFSHDGKIGDMTKCEYYSALYRVGAAAVTPAVSPDDVLNLVRK